MRGRRGRSPHPRSRRASRSTPDRLARDDGLLHGAHHPRVALTIPDRHIHIQGPKVRLQDRVCLSPQRGGRSAPPSLGIRQRDGAQIDRRVRLERLPRDDLARPVEEASLLKLGRREARTSSERVSSGEMRTTATQRPMGASCRARAGTPTGPGQRGRPSAAEEPGENPADADAKATHARAPEFVAKPRARRSHGENQASSMSGDEGSRRCRPPGENDPECWMARAGEPVSPRPPGPVGDCSLQPNGGQSSTPTDERRPAPEGARL